jgi:hypothetical protein
VAAKLTSVNERMNNFNNTIFVTNLRCERRGQLKLEIHVLFYRNNSATVAFRQIKFVTIICRGHIFKFYLNIVCFEESYKYGDNV